MHDLSDAETTDGTHRHAGDSMLDYVERPPSIRALKRHFLDRNRRGYQPDTLSCVANLILNVDDSREMMRLGLQHMVTQLGASRADAGMLTPRDPVYAPQDFYYNLEVDAPTCDGVSYSNRAAMLRTTWASRTPVFCRNVRGDPLFTDSMPEFEQIGTTSILFQQLTLDERPVGITCIDYVGEEHEWKPHELRFVHGFCTEFLGPLIGIHRYWNDETENQLRKPTEAELEAIRLAAEGLSSKEIARQLDKSYRTIENQLRHARLMLDAKTLPELINKCELWL